MIVSTWTRPLLVLVPTFILLACYAAPPSKQEMDPVGLEVRASEGVVESLPPSVKGGKKCGNGNCQKGETCSSCPVDCGACPVCGNGTCEAGETCSSCPVDCGACPPVCLNEICEAGEDPCNCPTDCPNTPNACDACECGGSDQGGVPICHCDADCIFFEDCCDNACMACGFTGC